MHLLFLFFSTPVHWLTDWLQWRTDYLAVCLCCCWTKRNCCCCWHSMTPFYPLQFVFWEGRRKDAVAYHEHKIYLHKKWQKYLTFAQPHTHTHTHQQLVFRVHRKCNHHKHNHLFGRYLCSVCVFFILITSDGGGDCGVAFHSHNITERRWSAQAIFTVQWLAYFEY